jgi:hypothetical protein
MPRVVMLDAIMPGVDLLTVVAPINKGMKLTLAFNAIKVFLLSLTK